MFFIVVYILVYQLIGNLGTCVLQLGCMTCPFCTRCWWSGYLKFNDAQNTVRLTLQEPTADCNPNDVGCKDTACAIIDGLWLCFVLALCLHLIRTASHRLLTSRTVAHKIPAARAMMMDHARAFGLALLLCMFDPPQLQS